MRVLVAPDKFRGTLSAAEAARAIAAGWRRVRPSDRVEEVPMADGGEGTLDALLSVLGGERRRVRVRGPLGDPVDAAFGLTAERPARAVVEMAAASGLALVSEPRRDPLRASTYGTGELIRAACRAGAREVIVGLGGSATTDGGAGMAQALGIRLLDAEGREVGSGGGGALVQLAGIDAGGLDPDVRRARFVAACDVEAPLTGPGGAAAVFGPQKGASRADVEVLDRALAHLAAIIHRDLGLDLRDVPGAGAAGGLGAGLVAFLGAHLRPGVGVVMEAVGLPARIEAADLVITGEGSFDAQSLLGKVAGGVIRAAREVGVPVVVLCGRSEVGVDGVVVESLVERVGEDRARVDARIALEDLAASVAERAPALSSRP